MSKLRLYVTVATFFILLITACYLEFPVVTVLILIFVVVLYLCCTDGKVGPLGLFGRPVARITSLTSMTRDGGAQMLTCSRRPGKGRGKESNKAALLTGLSGFSLTVVAENGWRYPFLQRRAFVIARSTLADQGLYCENSEQWLHDNDVANLKIEIFVENYQREVRLTVLLEVVGKITIIRSQASISEAASLWKKAVPRLTNSSEFLFDLEEALTTTFNALLRDYFGTSYGRR